MKLSPQYLAGVVLLALVMAFLRQATGAEEPPARPSFAAFPLELQGHGERRWAGQEVGLEQDVLEVLRVDDYMMRMYVGPGFQGPGPVWLYAGYYRSQRTGVTYHSPLNCLPGSGWSIVAREVVSVPLATGEGLRVNRVEIQKGLERQLILYWYQDRGRVITSEYWAKGYLVWDAMARNRTDGALVRISTPIVSSREEAFAVVSAFVQDTFSQLSGYLPS